jgi:hypothetical protein
MKKLQKTIIASVIFLGLISFSIANADNNISEGVAQKLVWVEQLTELKILYPQFDYLISPILSDLLNDLLNDLQKDLDKDKDKNKDGDDKKYKDKDEDKYVNGYYAVGNDGNIAKTIFTVPVKIDGDTDIQINGYDAFIFELEGNQYTGNQINALAGYTIEIQDSEGDNVEVGYLIKDGTKEEFEIKIFVDARSTLQGTGEYEIELDSLKYLEVDNAINSVLHINKDSQEIDLLA